MKKIRISCLLLVLLLAMTACGAQPPQNEPQQVQQGAATLAEPAGAAETADPMERAAQWLLASVKEPAVGSTFCEWAVLGLARAGVSVPDGYFETYYRNVEEHVKSCAGVLDSRKYTEYSRVVLALTAIGKDPTNVAGYDLVAPLADYDQTVFQGINGPTFALLALNSGGYALPPCREGETQASEEMYLRLLLEQEVEGGGWSFSGGAAEVDMTAMVLQALAHHRDAEGVEQAAERGVEALARMLGSGLEVSCEGIAQTVVALTELGIGLEDGRFSADGASVMDRLLAFRTEDGGFCHVIGGAADQMATEQAFYALAAAYRAEQGMTSLYDMSDVG